MSHFVLFLSDQKPPAVLLRNSATGNLLTLVAFFSNAIFL